MWRMGMEAMEVRVFRDKQFRCPDCGAVGMPARSSHRCKDGRRRYRVCRCGRRIVTLQAPGQVRERVLT